MFSLQATDDGEEIQPEEGQLLVIVSSLAQFAWQVHESNSLHILLEEFKDLFAKPLSLPSQSTFDHAIPLKPNSKPVNIQSYMNGEQTSMVTLTLLVA